MKLIAKLLAVLALLIALGAIVLFMQIDSLARSAVERGSTHALGVPTTLASADLGILGGELDLQGLRVSNPEGFESPHFMTLESGHCALTLGSLREDVVVLPMLVLEGIDLHLEKRGGQSNYKVILENLKRLESPERAPESREGKKFVIQRVEIRDVDVHVDLLGVGGELSKLDVPLELITLENVGSGGENGKDLAEVSGIVLQAIFSAVLAKGTLLPDEITAELVQALAGLGSLGEFAIEFAGEALGGIGQGVEEIGKGIGEVLEDAGRGVEDVLGGKKKD